MSKPIIVGYDPQTSDRAPVDFAVAAARFTGASLVVASVCAGPAACRHGDAARMEKTSRQTRRERSGGWRASSRRRKVSPTRNWRNERRPGAA